MPGTKRPLSRYRRGIRTSLRNNSAAYGYSLVATANFAILSDLVAPPSVLEIYLFIAGAVVAFALLEAITSRMFREKLRGEPSDVVMLGTAFSIFSIGAAVGTTCLVGELDSWVSWPLAAFGSTTCYLLVLGLEMALAERAEEKREEST